MTRKKVKRRRSRDAAPTRRRRQGVLIGMRSGFKSVARSVGIGQEPQPKRKRSFLSTAFTVLLVVAAGVVLYYRFGRG
jgi:hypothetical protein